VQTVDQAGDLGGVARAGRGGTGESTTRYLQAQRNKIMNINIDTIMLRMLRSEIYNI